MKANKSVRELKPEQSGQLRLVGGIVAFLLMVIIGVMIFWSTTEGIDTTGTLVERHTGYTMSKTSNYAASSNKTGWECTLDHTPDSKAAITNISCLNTSYWHSDSTSTFTLSGKTIKVAADAVDQFDQVNVTYTCKISGDTADTTDIGSTVFSLLPIVALALVASVIIGVIIGFGGGKKSGL